MGDEDTAVEREAKRRRKATRSMGTREKVEEVLVVKRREEASFCGVGVGLGFESAFCVCPVVL